MLEFNKMNIKIDCNGNKITLRNHPKVQIVSKEKPKGQTSINFNIPEYLAFNSPTSDNTSGLENTGGSVAKPSKHDFNFLYVIGKGGFGKVWKVESKKNKKLYAMK